MAKEPEKTTPEPKAPAKTAPAPKQGATPPDDPREPYPTGNPPDPQAEYDRAFPERKLERERAEAAEKAEKKEGK